MSLVIKIENTSEFVEKFSGSNLIVTSKPEGTTSPYTGKTCGQALTFKTKAQANARIKKYYATKMAYGRTHSILTVDEI